MLRPCNLLANRYSFYKTFLKLQMRQSAKTDFRRGYNRNSVAYGRRMAPPFDIFRSGAGWLAQICASRRNSWLRRNSSAVSPDFQGLATVLQI